MRGCVARVALLPRAQLGAARDALVVKLSLHQGDMAGLLHREGWREPLCSF